MFGLTKLERQMEHLRGCTPPDSFTLVGGQRCVAYAKGNRVLVAWEVRDTGYIVKSDPGVFDVEAMGPGWTWPLGTTDEYTRLTEAWEAAERHEASPWEAMKKAAKRMGIEPFVLEDTGVYFVRARSLFDCEPGRGDRLVVDPLGSAEGWAKELAASYNDSIWAVGYMSLENYKVWLAEGYWDSEPWTGDAVYGIVWDNADYEGYSFPSLEELKWYLH